MQCPGPVEFQAVMKSAGHEVFYRKEKRAYNLNIVGWRNKKVVPNTFNDLIAVYWESFQDWEGHTDWKYEYWAASTLPGTPWLLRPQIFGGTAILVPGQYQSAYKLGQYHGYIALRQVKPVKIWRDADLDETPDLGSGNIEEGLFGIHIHKAGVFSKLVGLSSAGCQVFQDTKSYNSFIGLCEFASSFWGDAFTYTLIEV